MHKLDDRMMEAWLGGWSAVAQSVLETVAMVAITAVQASGSGTITAQLLCDLEGATWMQMLPVLQDIEQEEVAQKLLEELLKKLQYLLWRVAILVMGLVQVKEANP